MVQENNNRTHEPNLRELTAEVAGVKELLIARIDSIEKVSNERDRRYEEHFKAMDEKTGLALAGSEKAVTKAETATEKRFDAVNEFRGTLSDQAANLMTKVEANTRFSSYDRDIQLLRESLKESGGQDMARKEAHSQNQWTFERVLTVVALMIAVASLFLRYGKP